MPRFDERRRAVDEMHLRGDRAPARALPTSSERDDVFSMLLLARDEDGEPLTDARAARRAGDAAGRRPRDDRDRPGLDLRPAAAHPARPRAPARGSRGRRRRTSTRSSRRRCACGRCPGRRPRRARRAVRARRLRDPAGRRDQPVDLGDPPPRPTAIPTRSEFRPERFLGHDAPDTYTWLPFGGGTRRCLGCELRAAGDAGRRAARARAHRPAGGEPGAREGLSPGHNTLPPLWRAGIQRLGWYPDPFSAPRRCHCMAVEEKVEFEGEITEALPT